MKIRFWQKTYLFTLAIFLVCLNVGILSLTLYTYQKNIESAETTVSAEGYYVAKSFERDYEALIGSDPDASVSLLFQSYGTFYAEKGLGLAFRQDGKVLYSTIADPEAIGKNTLLHRKTDRERSILISSEIVDGTYELIVRKNVDSLDREFRTLMTTFALTASGVSVLLAVVLYFVLRKLSRPLDKLKDTTEKIKTGDYSARIEEKGNDEFTLLSESFNLMLEKINAQMTELENEAERKQTLVDNMAHELRTPLTSIHGYAEYLEKANASDERRQTAIAYVMSETERLQKISQILLDDAFIRENKIEMQEISLDEILEKSYESLALRAEQAGVTLKTDLRPTKITGSETLLSMLFCNLIENAVKACYPGGEVIISCTDGSAFVSDNGRGMSSEQLKHITEPFYRTDKSRSRADGGAGLGLSLCKRIAVSHGAELKFASEPGKGTEASVIFKNSEDFTTRQ